MNISMNENEEIGTVKFPLSDCFCDAMLCKDFKQEQLQNLFKFFQGDEEIASLNIDLIVQRSEVSEQQKNALEAVDNCIKELQQTKKGRKSSTSVSDGKSSELLYSDFACPDELSENFKENLALGEHFYKIINGHLVNVKDKRGFCGDVCDTTKKYCKELKELPSKKPSSVDIFKLFKEEAAKKVELKCETQLEQKEMQLNQIREFLKNRFLLSQSQKNSEVQVAKVAEEKKPKKVKPKNCKNKKPKKENIPKKCVKTTWVISIKFRIIINLKKIL